MALIKQLTVSGYRSIRDLTLKLDRVNVIVGPNGCGKSNLYRALYLVAAAANGTLARSLADEGGLPSVFWAGKRHKNEKPRIRLSIEMEELGYELIFGRIPLGDRVGTGLEAFINDPDIRGREHRFLQRHEQDDSNH
jgi:predicted ATPase